MCQKSPYCCIGYILIIVGALNWGLVGAFNVNVVEMLLGSWPMLLRIVYVLVGLAGLGGLVAMAKHAGKCGYCSPHAGQ
ncbi:MAG: DUF378 domain-containing protein [Patescibacteria group bacterium]